MKQLTLGALLLTILASLTPSLASPAPRIRRVPTLSNIASRTRTFTYSSSYFFVPTQTISADYATFSDSCTTDPQASLPTCYAPATYKTMITDEAQEDVDNGILLAAEAESWAMLAYTLVETDQATGDKCPSTDALEQIAKMKNNIRKTSLAQPNCFVYSGIGGLSQGVAVDNYTFVNDASFDVKLYYYTALGAAQWYADVDSAQQVNVQGHEAEEWMMKEKVSLKCVETFVVSKQDQVFRVNDDYEAEVTV